MNSQSMTKQLSNSFFLSANWQQGFLNKSENNLTDIRVKFFLKYSAWALLLPLASRSKIIIFEETSSLLCVFMAGLGHEVQLVSNDKQWFEIIKKISKKEVLNRIKYISSSSDNVNSVFDEKYDAVLINGIDSFGKTNAFFNFDLTKYTKNILNILKEDGVLWLGSDNNDFLKFALKDIQSRKNSLWNKVFRLFLKRNLFVVDKYEFYPSYNFTNEIYPLSVKLDDSLWMKSTRTDINFKHKLLELVPLFFKEKYFIHAVGICLSKSNAVVNKSIIEIIIIKILGVNGFVEKIFLGNPDTVIIKAKGSDKDIIIRIPLSDIAGLRCNNSKQALEKIAIYENEMTLLVPNFFQQTNSGVLSLYVEQAVRGVPLSHSNISQDKTVEISYEVIFQFHLETRKKVYVDKTLIESSVLSLIANLVNNLPDVYKADLDWLERFFIERLEGEEVFLVANHGDFKTENILIDKNVINAVIDWDLFIESFYPLLDVIHLIAYNYVDYDGRELEEVIITNFINLNMSDNDRKIIDRYCSDMNISKDLYLALVCIYWLHNITCRFGGLGCFSEKFTDKRILPVFNEIKKTCYA